MPTIGHVAAGLAGSKLHEPGRPAVRSVLVFTALATFQDLDLFLPRSLGPAWGHRGALHSPAIALLAAAIGVLLLWDRGNRARTFLLAFLTAASHGILDALSFRGAGVLLLWPLSLAPFESPWQPLPPSPFSAHHFAPRFLVRVLYELLFFSPLFLWALWRRRAAPRSEGEVSGREA